MCEYDGGDCCFGNEDFDYYSDFVSELICIFAQFAILKSE